MADPVETGERRQLVLSPGVLVGLLLFAALFVAVALGLPLPGWLVLFFLVWLLFLPRSHDHGDANVEGRWSEAPATDPLASARELVDELPGDVFRVRGWEMTHAGLVVHGTPRRSVGDALAAAAIASERVLGRRASVFLHQADDGRPYLLVATEALGKALEGSVPRRRPLLNLGLFLATLVTTTMAGAAHRGVSLLQEPGSWRLGLPYALALMLILGVHEMGHYLAGRYHGVRVSLPYFVPIPFALGTFGAFISMPPLLKDRRQLFDIGVAGPLAGLAVAVPALFIGLRWSTLLPVDVGGEAAAMTGVSLNASLLLTLIAKASLGEAVLSGHYALLHPLAFAGWLGLLLTALNLVPVGQLDGGHVAQALFGSARARRLGGVALLALVALGLFVWSGLLFWALIVFFIAGAPGFPPRDGVTPLGPRRKAVGWLAFGVLVLILLPVPHALASGLGLHCPYL